MNNLKSAIENAIDCVTEETVCGENVKKLLEAALFFCDKDIEVVAKSLEK